MWQEVDLFKGAESFARHCKPKPVKPIPQRGNQPHGPRRWCPSFRGGDRQTQNSRRVHLNWLVFCHGTHFHLFFVDSGKKKFVLTLELGLFSLVSTISPLSFL
ncbi:hypothetical protein AMECASPLE_039438 [Ameca splendens]|uniref:Uncharacterized protein n=1 Tax=Ameca splendens TaxID=208324 RepID=A0ABV0XLG9_9TELE